MQILKLVVLENKIEVLWKQKAVCYDWYVGLSGDVSTYSNWHSIILVYAA